MMNAKRRHALALAGVVLAWTASWAGAEEAAAPAESAAPAPKVEEPKSSLTLETVVLAQMAADKEASASQQRINALDDETRELLQKYNQLTAEAESMTGYSDQLALQVQSQVDEIASYDRQLGEIEHTSRAVMPMIQTMLDRIDRFVELDLPFLLKERRERIAKLKEVMGRADVTISEKYRRVVEAYQIELDFGRTLEAYDDTLEGDPQGRTVKFLRVGRVALLYQTLDGEETGYWDATKKGWVVDNSYRHAVRDGFSVALKQGAPELIVSPISAPIDAQAAPDTASQPQPAAAAAEPTPSETQS
jgi:hypothetical protein